MNSLKKGDIIQLRKGLKAKVIIPKYVIFSKETIIDKNSYCTYSSTVKLGNIICVENFNIDYLKEDIRNTLQKYKVYKEEKLNDILKLLNYEKVEFDTSILLGNYKVYFENSKKYTIPHIYCKKLDNSEIEVTFLGTLENYDFIDIISRRNEECVSF